MSMILRLAAALTLLLIAGSSQAQAGSSTAACFSGNFTQDNDVVLQTFTLTASSDVSIQTFGYGGGTDACGNVIPAGGFDPVLSLFGPTGELITFNDDRDGAFDPNTFLALDSLITACEVPNYQGILDCSGPGPLAPGTYTVALTQSENLPLGNLGDGFRYTGGNPFFTEDFGCQDGQFCDAFGDDRSSAYAFSILATAEVPEPTSALLVLTGGLLMGLRRRRVR
jgi:hypothetical protein